MGFTRSSKNVVTVSAYDGVTRRTLWRRSYRMAGARNLGPFGAYDSATELDGYGGRELLIKLSGGRNEVLLALEAATGRVQWQRTVRGDAEVVCPRRDSAQC